MTGSEAPEPRVEQEDERRGAVPAEEKVDNKRLIKRPVEIVVFVAVVALYLFLSYALWRILHNYIQPGDDPAQRRGLVQALGLILVGLAGAIGIFFTWRGQQHAREAQEATQKDTQAQLEMTRKQLAHAVQAQKDNQENTRAQLDNAQTELNLTRQGQMTERFTQAVQQLGDKKLEIRLGGIYSLERTAQEEKNYHWPVMEVLTSYVRMHAARKPDEEPEDPDLFDPDSQAEVRPTLDIQAILDVIGRRSEHHRTDKKVEYGTIDLSNTNLRGASLHEAKLQGANLKEAYLGGADLWRANLREANLMYGILPGAVFRNAKLQKAFLVEAKLEKAVFRDACDLEHADFTMANLKEAHFLGANLRGANFGSADLQGANLHGARLGGSDRRAYFGGAKLQGADFRDTDLTVEQLDGAHWDESTLFSSELRLRLVAIEELRARLPRLEAEWRRALEEGTPEGKQREERIRAELLEIPQRIEDLRRTSPG